MGKGELKVFIMKLAPQPQELLSGNSPADYFSSYQTALSAALAHCPPNKIDAICGRLLEMIDAGRTLYVAGNGGSASIAEHLTCDWMKGTSCPGIAPLKVVSLVSNMALLTALANDCGYEYCFSAQIEALAVKGDVVFLVSSSGNSRNILEAAMAARAAGIFVIGLAGFGGGALCELADIAIHIPVKNYGLVEDAHQAIMHAVAQYLYSVRSVESRDLASLRAPLQPSSDSTN